MRLTTKLRYTAQLWLGKSLDFASSYALMPSWGYAFGSWGFHTIVRDGYQRNAAYLSCIAALAFSFPEPPLMCWDGEDASASQLPDHPLRKLLSRPNADMGEAEFKAAIVTWMAIGGNAYIYKLRNNRKQVIALRPYHDGVITPVASRDPNAPSLIDYYEFTSNEGRKVDVPREDVIHIKWPLSDPYRTYMAQPPILAAAREVDSDNEATRYVAALLQNDAVPRTIISPATDAGMSPDEKARLREIWSARHGGDRRGGVEVIDFGAKVERLSLNMTEMDFSALHDIPEQRICAVMRVPPSVAGLGDDPTYSNSEEAWNRFTRGSLVPLWRAVESEIQADLAPEFGDVVVRHDLGRVAALQEAEDAKWSRVTTGYTAGLLGFRESRSLLGQPAEPDPDDLFVTTGSAILERFSVIVSEEPEPPAITIVNPPPPQLPAPDAAQDVALLPTEDATKSRKAKPNAARLVRTLQRLRTAHAKRLERAVDAFFTDLAKTIASRATGSQKAAEDLPGVDELLEAGDWIDLEHTIKAFAIDLLDASWEPWNSVLGLDVAFELTDPAVVKALATSAENVKGIVDTTKDALRAVLQLGAEEGWTLVQLVSGVDDKPGLRDTVEETYKHRARTIARTEMATAQQSVATDRYKAAGVSKVTVFDGGSDDSDDICNQLNGSTQTLEWAEKNPLQHPQCVRCFAPYFSD
jgi:HK97 family phage portal protein